MWGLGMQSWCLLMDGETTKATAQLRSSIETADQMGAVMGKSHLMAMMANCHWNSGNNVAALKQIDDALLFCEEKGERYYEPELHRLKGSYLLGDAGDKISDAIRTEAQSCFLRGMEVAEETKAKSWKLRLATDLAGFWASFGRRAEARSVLSETFDWFTEGYSTPDLMNARQLLKTLD